MKYDLPERLVNEISRFAKKSGIRKIILFGSRARGINTKRSDIDIAVYGGDFDSFYWDVKENANSLLMLDIVNADEKISQELKDEIEKDGIILYEKFDDFSNCLKVLNDADFEFANRNEIYRTGVIRQFNLTFEFAWKALQAVLRFHGAEGADTGSPREILQLGYKFGFINDSSVWLLMLKKRNLSVHIYNEEDVEEMLVLIRDSFTTAFVDLEKVLEKR